MMNVNAILKRIGTQRRLTINTSLGFVFQIFDKISDNARLVLQIDNSRLAADDFKVKYVDFSSCSRVLSAVCINVANLGFLVTCRLALPRQTKQFHPLFDKRIVSHQNIFTRFWIPAVLWGHEVWKSPNSKFLCKVTLWFYPKYR